MFVDWFAGGVERAHAFLRIVDGQQRPVPVSTGAIEYGLERGVQADDDALGLQQVQHSGLHDKSAAAGDERARGAVALFNELTFHDAKSRLAVLRKDVRNGFPLLSFDFMVAVERGESEPLRDGAAHRGFPGAHETDKVEVDVRWIHRVRCPLNRAPRILPDTKNPMTGPVPNFALASDNTAGICPEAMAALQSANAGNVPSYGDDAHTAAARRCFNDLFERECDVFFVFNGTAANALVLGALCQRHHAVLCHELAHVETDECGAPEFFTGGSKLLPVAGGGAKLDPATLEPVMHRGHGVHFPKIRALSLTQSTELGTIYTLAELRALTEFARARGLAVQVDGARFANAAAAMGGRGVSPADLTWRAGVDVLCFGGTKNGLLSTEAVVFFDRGLAREFDYRVKQAGQLASKMRFASAQWEAVLRDGAWLRHAAHANRQAQVLSAGLCALGFNLVAPTEVNGVFVELPPPVVASLEACGWHFYKFVGEHGYRLMCSWETRDADVAAFLADAKKSRAGV